MKKSMTIQNGIWAGALPGGRKKTAQRRLYMGEFKGYSGKNGEMTLLNLETDFPFLRSHTLVYAVSSPVCLWTSEGFPCIMIRFFCTTWRRDTLAFLS